MNYTKENFLLKSDLSNFTSIEKLITESKYIDTSLVNGLRRYIIGKINTLAFDYSPVPMEINYINFIKIILI